MNTEVIAKSRKQADGATLESEQRYKRLLDSVTDYVYAVMVEDGRAVATVHGPGCEAVTGYTSDEFGTDQTLWYRMIREEDRREVLEQAERILRGEEPPPLEHRIVHKNGTERWIRNTTVPRKDAQGRLVAYDGLVYDITDRKQAEERLTRAHAELQANEEALKRTLEELKRANQQLKETQLELIQAARLESVGALAAGVAHEVKNPLQTILMGLDYLVPNCPSDNENIATVLTDMREAVTRANAIIRGLLQLSAQTDFEVKAEDLNASVRRALRLVNAQVIASKVTVVRKLDPHLPRVAVDRGKIEQVFINLLINALQAMSPGGVLTITTRTARVGENVAVGETASRHFNQGDRVVIAQVQDTGTGITPANLPKVFDPFFTTKAAGLGTGLGLSVVKKIVDLHGGAIDIQNAAPGGVVVTLVLKAGPEETLSSPKEVGYK
ncbi:MAG TPA: ATP-binding protein [Candidatus Acidoferrum sp.]|jgi:PAS domain S-box-containing protein|nr:ATP-binding protein [Candidatus Acidoferrum sp.]